jgi:nicotinate phosphoribosyltransferase
VAAARAAYIGGFDVTSNLAAGRVWGVPTAGTAAHAFTLAHAALVGAGTGTGHDDEIELTAFRAQLDAQGPSTTLLVDTFDIEAGIRNAVRAAREIGAGGPGAIRIDSGDLDAEARRARALLDSLGADRTRVVITSDVDEYVIDGLERGETRRLRAGDPGGDVALRAPVDAFGVGTRVVSGSGHPSAGFVYKCTAIAVDDAATAFVGVGKTSAAKASRPGRALAWRGGDPVAEIVATAAVGDEPSAVQPPVAGARPLVARVLDAGRRAPIDRVAATAAARERCAASLAELGSRVADLAAPAPALPTRIEEVHHDRGT